MSGTNTFTVGSAGTAGATRLYGAVTVGATTAGQAADLRVLLEVNMIYSYNYVIIYIYNYISIFVFIFLIGLPDFKSNEIELRSVEDFSCLKEWRLQTVANA